MIGLVRNSSFTPPSQADSGMISGCQSFHPSFLLVLHFPPLMTFLTFFLILGFLLPEYCQYLLFIYLFIYVSFIEVQLGFTMLLIASILPSDSVTHTHTHTHIYILFHILFHYGLSQDIGYSSLWYSLLFIHPTYNSLPLLIPNSRSFLLPPRPPWKPQVCSLYLLFCFCFIDMLICIIFQLPHVSGIIWYLSFSV